MVLRELTEAERAELSRFILHEREGNDYQVLLAMIAVDFMKENAFGHQLSYPEFADYIEPEAYYNHNSFLLTGLLQKWISGMAEQDGITINEKIEKDILNLVYTLEYAPCGRSSGFVGKKHREMRKFYDELDKEMEEKGQYLAVCPEENYRYIVTCLEYMGFKRVPSTGTEKIDMRGVFYNDLHGF